MLSFLQRVFKTSPAQPHSGEPPRTVEPTPPSPDQIPEVEIAQAADYEIQLAKFYVKHFADLGVELEGARILELGPGGTPGMALVLASLGAKVTIADRYLATWRPEFHPRVLRGVEQRWGSPLAAVQRSIEASDFAVTQLRDPAESPQVEAGSFDVVHSNAVLEHVEDIEAVVTELARVTKPGGINSHQVDFRDHRDFSRPLEYLTTTGRLAAEGDTYTNHYGSRRRPAELLELFCRAGFHWNGGEPRVLVDTVVDEAYFADFLPRLRASGTPYSNWPEEKLRPLGARFICRAAG